MQATQRHAATGVIAHLLDEPHRYQFMQAVGLLLRWLRQQGVPPDQALNQVLRFRSSLSLAFPASDIERLALDDDGRLALTPAFIGFLGNSGALPLHYTQRIAGSQFAGKDDGVSAFLDIFSHRMVALFYQACGKYRLEHRLDVQATDAQLPILLALFGVPGLQYEVRLILSAPCVTGLVLSNAPARQRRLGWTTFLPTQQGQVRGAEVRYLLPVPASTSQARPT